VIGINLGGVPAPLTVAVAAMSVQLR